MIPSVTAQIESLHVGLHDVVVIHLSDADDAIDVGRRVKEELNKRGHDNLVMVIRDGATLDALCPETMARYGWFRKASKRDGE